MHRMTCRICADICNACADDCSKLADDEAMVLCAETCRRCAQSVRPAGGYLVHVRRPLQCRAQLPESLVDRLVESALKLIHRDAERFRHRRIRFESFPVGRHQSPKFVFPERLDDVIDKD